MTQADYDRLLKLLAEKSFMYSEEPSFRLASGTLSSYYINCKKTAYDPEGIDLIGRVFFDILNDKKPDAVGGLTLGADPLAVAAAGESHRRGRPFKAFVIRKQPKKHGTMLPIEGGVIKGNSVVILEDVTTTGESAMKAVKAAREYGLDVMGVLTLVDRQEGGRERIEGENLQFNAVFTKEQIFERYKLSDEP